MSEEKRSRPPAFNARRGFLLGRTMTANTHLFARIFKRLFLTLLILSILILVGTVGYTLLEGLTAVDALYMTIITISTVGFGEVKPLSQTGRIFTILLILGGSGLAAFSISTIVDFIVSGQWREYRQHRRRTKMINTLSRHVIVCGFGRVGRHVSDELKAEGIPFVIIDADPERIEHAEKRGYLTLKGNAAREDVLIQAGIRKARGLVAAVNSDAENVFIVLTARSLNESMYIVSRANYEDSEPKLLRAGANRTIQPYLISGKRMVTMLMRPNVADFLDEVAHAGGMELILEQIEILPGSSLDGKKLAESNINSRFGVTVLACRSDTGEFHTPPGPNTLLLGGISVIVLGTPEQIKKLMQAAKTE